MTAERRTIHDEVVIAQDRKTGRRITFVLPVVPEDAPYRVREGIARRRLTALTGACPCGATMTLGDANAVHEYGCPAITATLEKAIRRWAR
jgi:hypothetical protein